MRFFPHFLLGIGAGVFLFVLAATAFPPPTVAQDGGALQAILRSDPSVDSFGAIPLLAAGGSIRLIASDSLGEIVSYAIDINTAVDSDSDGRANNDADNALHPSFRTGESWTVNLRAAQGEKERWLRLTVTDSRGMSDTLELLITFVGETIPQETVLRTEQTILRVGEQFTLRIENVPVGTLSYSWDLQGDQVEDSRTDVPFLLLQPDAPGVLPVRVSLFDSAGMLLNTVSGEFSIGAAAEEVPDTPTPQGSENILTIHAEAVGLSTAFYPELLSPLNLLRLEPTWSFGDGAKSYLLEPVYTYAVPGSYDVLLSLRDPQSGDEVAVSRATVTVAEGAGSSEEGRGFLAGIGTFFRGLWSLVSGAVVAILTLALVLLLVLGGIFLFLSYEAKRKGTSLKEALEAYRKMFFRGVDESPRETTPAPMPSKKVGEEKPLPVFTAKPSPAPSKLSVPSAPFPAAGKSPAPSAPSSSETESLPPWLRPKTSAPSQSTPPVPQQKAAVPVSAPTPPPAAPSKPSLPSSPPPPPPAPNPQTAAPAPSTPPPPVAPKPSTPPPPAPPKAGPEKGPLPPWLTPKPPVAEPKTAPATQAATPASQPPPQVQKSEVSASPLPKTSPANPLPAVPSPTPQPPKPSTPLPPPPPSPQPKAAAPVSVPPPPAPATPQKESVPPWLQKSAPALPPHAASQTLPASSPPPLSLPSTSPTLSLPKPSTPSLPPATKSADAASKDDLEPLAFIKAEDVFPEIPPMEGKPPAKQ